LVSVTQRGYKVGNKKVLRTLLLDFFVEAGQYISHQSNMEDILTHIDGWIDERVRDKNDPD